MLLSSLVPNIWVEIEAAGTDKRYSARSKFLRSLGHKKMLA